MEHAQRAMALKPDYINAHLLLGDVFLKQHKLDEAIAAYRQALALDPTHAGAHNNIGAALFGQGHLNEAAQSFKEAIRLKPDVITAYRDLATIYILGGDASQALNVVMQGLQSKETPSLKVMFVRCLTTATSFSDSDALRQYIVRALSEPWGHPAGIVPPSTALVKLTPPIKRCLDRASASWPAQLSCDGTVRFRRLARRRQRPIVARPAAKQPCPRHRDGAVLDPGPLSLAQGRHSRIHT